MDKDAARKAKHTQKRKAIIKERQGKQKDYSRLYSVNPTHKVTIKPEAMAAKISEELGI